MQVALALGFEGPVGVGGWGWGVQGPGMGVIKWPLAGPGDKLDLEGGCSTNYTAANDFVPYQPHAEKISLYWMVYESLVMVQVLNPSLVVRVLILQLRK